MPKRNYTAACYFTFYSISIGQMHIGPGAYPHMHPVGIATLRLGYKKTRELFQRMLALRGEYVSLHPACSSNSQASCGEASGPVHTIAPEAAYNKEDDAAIDTFH
ncbi:hypothetical protein SERLA73DRAFT_72355 [Serpula lacrymans var. lacrymans S7.3]|uniref:Uncharacterized protein n=2 Tax=Serpula lacrymans var. lacrymans TaxID=341189 RepID=F8PVU2_SERL3|nr:hypothetical protein SERLA73DRAFT_72355 [Serpula lacrymans var. lacrymans S7.3]